jgi:Common central domain of tyrosinase.
MAMNRRQLAGSVAGGAALVMAGPVAAQSASRIRRAASSLSPTSDTLVALADGIRQMRARSDSLSWANQARIHARQAQHGNGLFLPWHRLELSHFERIIGRLSGMTNFAMPYWDWQGDRTLPRWMVDPSTAFYERQRNRGVESLDFNRARYASSANVARVYEDDFYAFCGRPNAAGRVEAYGHNIIHMLIGGLMGSVATATLDPVFWFHHANIDRVWDSWHRRRGSSLYPQRWLDLSLNGFVGADGSQTGNWLVSRVTDTRNLGYQYDVEYGPQFLVFAPSPGAEGGSAAIRPIAPLAAVQFRATGVARPGDRSVTAIFPREAMERLRRTDRRVEVKGEGTVLFRKDANLIDRAVVTDVMANGRKNELGVSPTFVHIAPADGMDHSAHMAQDTYGHVFTFGQETLELLRFGNEPLRVVSYADDLRPDLRRPQAQAVSLDCTLTLTEYAIDGVDPGPDQPWTSEPNTGGGTGPRPYEPRPPESRPGHPHPQRPRPGRPGSGYYGERG